MKHWLLERLQSYGDSLAISDSSGQYTYAQLHQAVIDNLNFLEERFQPGQKVILESDYNFNSIALFVALSLSRQIAIPVINSNKAELQNKISVSGADALIKVNQLDIAIRWTEIKSDNSLAQKITERQHSGLILFSSGTTGEPKAMLHDLTVLLDTYRDKRPRKLAIMVFLMFDHIGGINTLFNILAMGAKAVIPENRNPETIARLIENEQVNILPASPTFLNLLILSEAIADYDLSSIRMITYGTEPMPEALLSRIKQHFPKAKLLQTFGTSETGIAQIKSRSSNSLDIKIDDPNLDYKVVNGELWLKSKTTILGYLNAGMEQFTDDGWFKTGDIVEERGESYLKIIGRKSDIINVGGEKVLPIEVESFLMSIEGVQDCLVFGEKNALTGQNVAAIIVKKTDFDEQNLKNTIRKECIRNIQRYKVPAKIYFKNALDYSSRFKKSRKINNTESLNIE